MTRKVLYLLKILTVAIVLFASQSMLNAQSKEGGIRTLVIDPGHGGSDPGTVGKLVKEKEINLAVALKFGKLVEEWFPDVKVLYTRKTDERVDIYKRAEFANENNADFFISIHANALDKDATDEARNLTSGSETWIMGMHKSEENLQVAMFENSVIKEDADYEENYEGFDPTKPEAYIIFSLMQDAYMEQSLRMAEFIQDEFINGPVKRNRGIKQAGFVVLWKTAAPSVLIELGFVSNPQEELILIDDENRQQMAECLFRAFQRYKMTEMTEMKEETEE